MNSEALLAEIMRLSPADRIDLIGQVWDATAASPDNVPMPAWQVTELERRLEEPNPQYFSWDEVRESLLGATSRKKRYRVLISTVEDGVFVAEVPGLPGCVTQGETREEAVLNVREAIVVYLESLAARGEPVAPPITEEIVEI